MNLAQVILATTASKGAVLPPQYTAVQYGANGEGYNAAIYINYSNAVGATVYWSINADLNYPTAQQADPTTDLTSDNGYSGSISPTGTGQVLVANLTNVADNLTEGIQYYAIKLGTSAGASDIGYFGGININDLSQFNSFCLCFKHQELT